MIFSKARIEVNVSFLIPEEFPSDRKHVDERVIWENACTLVQDGEGNVEQISDLWSVRGRAEDFKQYTPISKPALLPMGFTSGCSILNYQ